MKPKPTRKIPEPPKNDKKCGPPLLREKRVFGTARNPNIPSTTASKNPAKGKPSSGPLKKAAKPSQATRSPLPGPPTAEAKSSSGKNPARPKKKSVCFQENEIEKNGNVVEPQTPLKSPAAQAKPRLSGSATPYRSAEKCSKCRFDRLETSSYWLCQIKLAETVGKHFVSAVFFRLAFDCGAEPIRNIRVELKKYLARHEYLNGEEEWKKLSVSYGLVKEESSENPGEVMAAWKKKMQVLASKKMRIWCKKLLEKNET
ncbi:hypothetical protein DH2020_024314 [Rehmannia glutinosa]|uniref:Uncharacterized protein n=1 Tax=Rehmannia glutinosa TaxID=99300 RepID=A0ABR0W5G2_REHGL